jgi:hypothetical protein
MIDYKNN